MNKIETEAQVHGRDLQLSEVRGDRMEGGERINQRTYMHDPCTRTVIWGVPEGGSGSWVAVGKGRNSGKTVTE